MLTEMQLEFMDFMLDSLFFQPDVYNRLNKLWFDCSVGGQSINRVLILVCSNATLNGTCQRHSSNMDGKCGKCASKMKSISFCELPSLKISRVHYRHGEIEETRYHSPVVRISAVSAYKSQVQK
jgi:hypothetical protein